MTVFSAFTCESGDHNSEVIHRNEDKCDYIKLTKANKNETISLNFSTSLFVKDMWIIMANIEYVKYHEWNNWGVQEKFVCYLFTILFLSWG